MLTSLVLLRFTNRCGFCGGKWLPRYLAARTEIYSIRVRNEHAI